MSSHESSVSTSVPEPAGSATHARRGPRSMGWTVALAMGIAAGVAAGLIGERTYQVFKASTKASADPYVFGPLNRETARANGRNGALTFGILGGLLGLGMGAAGGISRRSVRMGFLGAVAGLSVGAAAGALPSFVLMPYQWNHRNDDPSATDLMMPLLIHLGLWTGTGLAAGLAFSVGRGQTRPLPLAEAALRGLVGAALGTLAFELLGAFLFPTARTTEPFSETSSTRLLARLCVCLFVAITVALPISSRPPKRHDPATPPEVLPT